MEWYYTFVCAVGCTVNFKYTRTSVPPGKKERSLYAKCHYIRNAHFMALHILALRIHVCMDAEVCACVTCVTWRTIPSCTCTVSLNFTCTHVAVLYAGTLRWHGFSQVHALSHAFSARVDCCALWFSSMAMLKLSNWSACCYIRSDLGPSCAKYVLLLAKCRYSRYR